MSFYYPLPIEIWFIIYKMEHSSFLGEVNKKIKTLNREIELLNKTESDKIASPLLWMYDMEGNMDGEEFSFDYFSDFPRIWAHCCPQMTGWTIKEWNSFRYVHPTIIIRNNGSLDISSPRGAYGYGFSPEMRREVVVKYLFDWSLLGKF